MHTNSRTIFVNLKQSPRNENRYMVRLFRHTEPMERIIHFGKDEPYIAHKDINRKLDFIKKNKIKDKTDVLNPTFWDVYLLHNRPELEASVKELEKKWNMMFINDKAFDMS